MHTKNPLRLHRKSTEMGKCDSLTIKGKLELSRLIKFYARHNYLVYKIYGWVLSSASSRISSRISRYMCATNEVIICQFMPISLELTIKPPNNFWELFGNVTAWLWLLWKHVVASTDCVSRQIPIAIQVHFVTLLRGVKKTMMTEMMLNAIYHGFFYCC